MGFRLVLLYNVLTVLLVAAATAGNKPDDHSRDWPHETYSIRAELNVEAERISAEMDLEFRAGAKSGDIDTVWIWIVPGIQVDSILYAGARVAPEEEVTKDRNLKGTRILKVPLPAPVTVENAGAFLIAFTTRLKAEQLRKPFLLDHWYPLMHYQNPRLPFDSLAFFFDYDPTSEFNVIMTVDTGYTLVGPGSLLNYQALYPVPIAIDSITGAIIDVIGQNGRARPSSTTRPSKTTYYWVATREPSFWILGGKNLAFDRWTLGGQATLEFWYDNTTSTGKLAKLRLKVRRVIDSLTSTFGQPALDQYRLWYMDLHPLLRIYAEEYVDLHKKYWAELLAYRWAGHPVMALPKHR